MKKVLSKTCKNGYIEYSKRRRKGDAATAGEGLPPTRYPERRHLHMKLANKRTLAKVTAVAMAASMLAACGSSGSSTASSCKATG